MLLRAKAWCEGVVAKRVIHAPTREGVVLKTVLVEGRPWSSKTLAKGNLKLKSVLVEGRPWSSKSSKSGRTAQHSADNYCDGEENPGHGVTSEDR